MRRSVFPVAMLPNKTWGKNFGLKLCIENQSVGLEIETFFFLFKLTLRNCQQVEKTYSPSIVATLSTLRTCFFVYLFSNVSLISIFELTSNRITLDI